MQGSVLIEGVQIVEKVNDVRSVIVDRCLSGFFASYMISGFILLQIQVGFADCSGSTV